MNRRRFNSRERVALWLAAGGRCEICGEELKAGWHADHVHPYSRGGSTDVINGAALCPSCNEKKGNTIMAPPTLRKWQQDALSKYLSTSHDFLVEATPGAGKTRMALAAALELINAGEVQRLVVVVPSVNLQSQWSQAAAALGLDLTSSMKNRDGAITAAKHGAVVTYPQVANEPLLWRKITGSTDTLVILDEVHHAGQDEKWGAALREAFEVGVRRLMLSGTPFRTDRTPIPFVRYDDNGYAIADAGLSYGEAVRNGVVRPVRYEVLDGRADWVDLGTQVSVNLSEAKQADISDALHVLFEPSQDWMPSVFRRANEELTRAREEMPDAGGLILANSKWHAEHYARIMTQISGEPTPAIHSELDDATDILRKFAEGTSRWLVAVRMVSEGVDIPRLLVGVYASTTTTEMWFRQVTGRFVRSRSADETVNATILIPHVDSLMQLAERIESEARVALDDEVREAQDRGERESRTMELNFIEALAASESVLSAAITSGENFSDAELEEARLEIERIGGSFRAVHVADMAKYRRQKGTSSAVNKPAVFHIPPSKITGDQERLALRKQLALLVSKYASVTSTPHKNVNYKLNQLCGGTKVATSDADGLRKRIATVSEWLQVHP